MWQYSELKLLLYVYASSSEQVQPMTSALHKDFQL